MVQKSDPFRGALCGSVQRLSDVALGPLCALNRPLAIERGKLGLGFLAGEHGVLQFVVVDATKLSKLATILVGSMAPLAVRPTDRSRRL